MERFDVSVLLKQIKTKRFPETSQQIPNTTQEVFFKYAGFLILL